MYKRYFSLGCLHFSILTFFTFKETKKRFSFYNVFKTTTEKNYLHLLHVSFLIFLIYCVTAYTLFKVIGPLRPQEVSVLNDNLFLFLTDILLVLSVFSKDMNFRNILIFFIVLCLKGVGWMVTTRIDHCNTTGMVILSLITGTLSLLMSIFFLYLSYFKISIFFLFAFEFALVSLSSFKNIFNMQLDLAEDDDERSLYSFYIEITYLSLIFIFYVVFIVITSVRFKVPLNVFRSSIAILERLINKIKLFKKYLKLCEDLNKCEEAKGDPTCPICREDMEVGKKLRCKHVFHLECLKKWCERQQFCPICKVDLMLSLKEEVVYTPEERIVGVPVEIVE